MAGWLMRLTAAPLELYGQGSNRSHTERSHTKSEKKSFPGGNEVVTLAVGQTAFEDMIMISSARHS